jgi:hypothetical protein
MLACSGLRRERTMRGAVVNFAKEVALADLSTKHDEGTA